MSGETFCGTHASFVPTTCADHGDLLNEKLSHEESLRDGDAPVFVLGEKLLLGGIPRATLSK